MDLQLDRHRVAWSVQEAAQLTSLSPDAIYQEIYAGRLTSRRHGRRHLIPDDALREWFAALPTELERQETDWRFSWRPDGTGSP